MGNIYIFSSGNQLGQTGMGSLIFYFFKLQWPEILFIKGGNAKPLYYEDYVEGWFQIFGKIGIFSTFYYHTKDIPRKSSDVSKKFQLLISFVIGTLVWSFIFRLISYYWAHTFHMEEEIRSMVLNGIEYIGRLEKCQAISFVQWVCSLNSMGIQKSTCLFENHVNSYYLVILS